MKSEPEILQMNIPDVPPSLNELLRMHWAKKIRLQAKWEGEIWVAMPKRFDAAEKMRVRITLYHSRFYDKDNAYGAVKPIVDSLRKLDLIRDDTAEHLELEVEQAKCPHKQRHTVIEIEAAK